MFENVDVQEAVRRSILTEKYARDFYLLGARHMGDEESRKVFELLAREERDHARSFYDIYPGDDLPPFDQLMEESHGGDNDWLTEKERKVLADSDVRQTLELAMEKEKELEDQLRQLMDDIEDPAVKQVYESNAKSTHNHYVLIESEYARLMGMVHETDMDTFVRE
ncbi:MAG TPA: ferritin family protein [Desulfuromonadales bacterium]|nr:ferritin family protein [Desulfuromonadales bacterium]